MKSQSLRKNLGRKIRILGIAPYEGMKTIMQKIAAERDDVELDVFVGDLNKGLEIARRSFHSDYDAVISRGGTADLLGKEFPIPIIDVTLSVYDILRAIKLAENYTERYAIIGFPTITENAHLLCDLLQYHIDIFTINDQSEVIPALENLKKNGYRMVLCDMISNTTAKKLGLNAILVTSGAESIASAFDQAVKLSTSYASAMEENRFLRRVIEGGESQTAVLNANGEVFYSNVDENLSPQFWEMLEKELPSVLSSSTRKFFKNLDGTLYSFICRVIPYMDEQLAVFYFNAAAVPFATSKYGIQYSNHQEAQDLFLNSIYSVTNSANSIQTTIENLNHTLFPAMLSGETGTGKEQVARAIYSASNLKSNPMITINCPLINDRSWTFLTNHYNSPFNDNDNTIFFKEIQAFSENRRKHLLSLIQETNLSHRNRLIFSCSLSKGSGMPPEIMEFVNQLSCITIHLSPLRECAKEIPTLSSLYLNMLNSSIANQIIGFEPEAMQLLQEFDWPYNYVQFKRIMSELAMAATSPYIRTEQVRQLLGKELITPETSTSLTLSKGKKHLKNSSGEHTFGSDFHFSGTLEEMNRHFIHLVLDNCEGNQSAAAKRLGISRTTLWRYLK